MSSGGALFFLLALALCSLVVLAPLFAARRPEYRPGRQARHRALLQLQYDQALTALRDLDEERFTGKIDADRHRQERERWLQRAERLLAELDALQEDGQS